MADQDKDLPLVVSEILIEMHGMNSRLRNVENRLENVENILTQVVGSIQYLSGAVGKVAEVINKQQEANTANFKMLMEADERNTSRLENAIQSFGLRFDSLEYRLERLENK
ncbi:hypothetical protein GKZ68_11965 [Hymenobacter sp. BRD128]|uniref:hypothetical protein n=1 Tax=Hymenobacter sp. BRD128 TaxID=2675878 RepID=UPI001565E313|nr:hypothetical protein [Hymenobacter sp. BRD128]QKG57271.1 hypothetical protein GKZ68_11965 [Hymenobacter sp. BRD128]